MTRNGRIVWSLIAALFIAELFMSYTCSVGLLMLPIAAFFMVFPAAIVGLVFKGAKSPVPSLVAMGTVVPLMGLAFYADCLAPYEGGGAAMGGVIPWLYGIPGGLLFGWVAGSFYQESSGE